MKAFEPYVLNGLTLQNRFVRSATHTGFATDEGIATEKNKDILFTLAENNVGLIITGYMYISKDGKGARGQLSIDRDETIKELFEITHYIHKYTRTKIFAQIAHCGAQTTENITGQTPIAPSQISHNNTIIAREMQAKDIEQIIEHFSDSAIRAKEAAFDGIQIHAAHGYLLSEFLSGHFNKRTDMFGQNNKGRARIISIILEHVRKKVGTKFPILLKINSEDFLQDGLHQEDCLEILGYIIPCGIDGVEISGGTMNSDPLPIRKEDNTKESSQFYYRDFCEKFRKKFSIPLIAMGGIRGISEAERILGTDQADLIGMSRPFICEPDIIKRWEKGDPLRAKCISCNKCFRPLLVGKGLNCEFVKKE
ncbi:MAG: NADH:flavin oxidoreductase [Candidatus Omnitrophica bacterium]|nr:NADH:flavin oxidoreductase [Candidatus Omnitrophota bacterium]